MRRQLARAGLLRTATFAGDSRLLTSGCAHHFARLGSTFLGQALEPDDIEIVGTTAAGIEPPAISFPQGRAPCPVRVDKLKVVLDLS